MTKRKGQNKLWWFISWLQVILLAIPLLDVAKNCIFNSHFISEYGYINVNGDNDDYSNLSSNSSYLFTIDDNDLLNYSLAQTCFNFSTGSREMYFDGYSTYIVFGSYDYNYFLYFNEALENQDGVFFADLSYEDRMYVITLPNYNITNFDFLFMFNQNSDNFMSFNADGINGMYSLYKVMFFNWYMNYILTILIVFFIPYLLVFIFSWFTSFAEGFINKSTKGDD